MESMNERHITDVDQLMKLVRVVDTLCSCGRPLNVAMHDIAHSYGLTRADVMSILKLVRSNNHNIS